MRSLRDSIIYAAITTLVYNLTGYRWVIAIGGLLTLSALARAAFTALDHRRAS